MVIDGPAINPPAGKVIGVLEAERGGKWTGPHYLLGLSWPVFEDNEMVELITYIH